jgi:YVTN family beta-propeller protein
MAKRRKSPGSVFLVPVAALLLAALVNGDARGAPPSEKPAAADNSSVDLFVREGVAIEFLVDSVTGKASGRDGLMEGDYADVKFRITDETRKGPIRSLRPGAWMDIAKALESRGGKEPDCREKVGLYLKGIVGMRPLIDLSGYHILVLNRDPSISVINPYVGMTGKTNLYAMVPLKQPGSDWIMSRDGKRLYVSLPKANQVAVVDTDAFKVEKYIDVGENPSRIALQPDGAYVWVGNDAGEGREGGVTVIDTVAVMPIATLPTGHGHHEITFTSDSRYAYVTNRSGGTVSVIDVRERKKVNDLKTGPTPISLDFSALGRAVYLADGRDGTVSVVDVARNEVAAKIDLKPGLGPLKFTPDGRWGFALNPKESDVAVIDASTNRVAHTIPVGKGPFQIAITPNFAHVLSLETEMVSMIPIHGLGKDAPLPVHSYPIGAEAPGLAQDLIIAQSLSTSAMENEMLVVNPANRTIYDYMEGMNFPRGSFQAYGREPRAVLIVDRSLKETDPGVYSTRVKVPVAAVYDVALILDSPRIVHCFRVEAKENPAIPRVKRFSQVEFLAKERKVTVGETVPFRFRIVDPETKAPKTGLTDVGILYYAMPGTVRTREPAREVEAGVYEALLKVRKPGTHYVYVTSASLPSNTKEMIFYTVVGVIAPAEPKGPGEGKTDAAGPRGGKGRKE